MQPVIDHFGINCSDWNRSQQFYDTVLAVLGYSRIMEFGPTIGYGTGDKPVFWIADAAAGEATGPNREVHIAFAATDPDAVRAFYQAAVDAGAEALHPPRSWPESHPGYYGAFVRDPDGNNVEAVCHDAPRPGPA